MTHSVDGETDVGVALELATRWGTDQLVVTSQGKVSGLVCARDLHLASILAPHRKLPLHVRDVCTALVYVADLDEPLDEVLLEMADRRVSAAVVVNASGSVLGILTAAAVCYLFATSLRGRTPLRLRLAAIDGRDAGQAAVSQDGDRSSDT